MQVIWNGEVGAPFYPNRGIPQGDPLSPYIFVLCMERLSQAIGKVVEEGGVDTNQFWAGKGLLPVFDR